MYQTPGSAGQVGTTREWTAHNSYSGSVLVTLADDGDTPTLSISRHVESAEKSARAASVTTFVISTALSVFYLFGNFPTDVAYLLAAFFAMSAILFGLGSKLEAWKHRRARDKIRATLNGIELAGMRHAPNEENEQSGALSSDVLQDDISTEGVDESRQRRRTR